MKADELRSYRKKKKMTQAEMATWLEVSKRTVVAWENGQNPVPSWVRNRINVEGTRLNPKLSFEALMQAKKKAEDQGMTFDEWVADLINKALMLGLVVGLFYLFI